MRTARLLRTIRHLKPRQILYRLYYRFVTPNVGRVDSGERRAWPGRLVRSVPKARSIKSDFRFRLLNTCYELTSPDDWNDAAVDKLLLYNLHYFDGLNSETSDLEVERHLALIRKWIAENPAPNGNGWEPYVISLRIVNLVKWMERNDLYDQDILDSLRIQARILSQRVEYHILANHLFANAKALLFAGAFLNGDEADGWLSRGLRLLKSELDEQILSDGGHFERSPMYHAIILEDVLDVRNLISALGIEDEVTSASLICRMFHWLDCMSHPDGRPAHFNDSVAGVAPGKEALCQYAERLDVQIDAGPKGGLVILDESGYGNYEGDGFFAIVDVGDPGPPYQLGHAHCDCLSFEISVGQSRVIVNSGISTYNECERRTHERSTEAHSTVGIGGLEQSENWGAFRVGRRFQARILDRGTDFLVASHSGYSSGRIEHVRRFEFSNTGILLVDTIIGDVAGRAAAHFHFHPDIAISSDTSSVTAGPLRLEFEGHGVIEETDYEYCQGFNSTMPAKKIVVRFDNSLRTLVSI